MSGYLLDTNVLSELRKENRSDPGVQRWFAQTAAHELFVSVVVLGEIRHGIQRIGNRDAAQARTLEKWLRWTSDEFADHILPIDKKVADQWGRLGIQQPIPVLDAFLAATAITHDLVIVSRDEAGFRNSGASVFNPFG